MGFRFIPDKAGIREVLRDAEVGRFITRKASDAADAARTHAPVGSGVGAGGYEDSIDYTPAKLELDGWRAEVYSDDIAWHLVEFGSINNPPYRPLMRGVRDAGLDYEDGR
jgi:hypothetical protein